MGISSRIREARKRLLLTQEDLAERIGVTKGAIANYENGVSTPKIDILYALMKVLGVDANYLFDYVPSGDFRLSDHERNLIISYRSKPDMQPAIDTLLGLSPVSSASKNA